MAKDKPRRLDPQEAPAIIEDLRGLGVRVPDPQGPLTPEQTGQLEDLRQRTAAKESAHSRRIQELKQRDAERELERQSLRRERTERLFNTAQQSPEEAEPATAVEYLDHGARRDFNEERRTRRTDEQGIVRRGLRSGTGQLLASIPATEALLRGAVGDEEGARRAADEARVQLEDSAEIAPQTSLRDVVEGEGSFIDWSFGVGAQQTPVLLSFLASGGVGGAVAKGLQSAAIRGVTTTAARAAQATRSARNAQRQVQRAARASQRGRSVRSVGRRGTRRPEGSAASTQARQQVDEAAARTARFEEAADQARTLRQRLIDRTPYKVALGQATGAAVTGTGLHAADTSQWLIDPDAAGTVQQRALSGLGVASLAALTEIAPTLGLLRNLRVGTTASHMTQNAMKTHSATRRIATGTAKQATLEAQAEVMAEITKDVGYSFVNENKELFTSDDMWKYFESAAAGGLIGGLSGGITSARPSDFLQWREAGPTEAALADRHAEREVGKKRGQVDAEERRKFEELGFGGEFEGFDADQREQRSVLSAEERADIGLTKMVGHLIKDRMQLDLNNRDAVRLGQAIRLVIDPDAANTMAELEGVSEENLNAIFDQAGAAVAEIVGAENQAAVMESAADALISAEAEQARIEENFLRENRWPDSKTGEYRTLSSERRSMLEQRVAQRKERIGRLLEVLDEDGQMGLESAADPTSAVGVALQEARGRQQEANANPDPEAALDENEAADAEEIAESGFGGVETLEVSPQFPLAGEGRMAQSRQRSKNSTNLAGAIFKRGQKARTASSAARKQAERLGDGAEIVNAGDAIAQAIQDRGLDPQELVAEARRAGADENVTDRASAREYLNQFDAVIDASPPAAVTGKDEAVLTDKDLDDALEERQPGSTTQIEVTPPEGAEGRRARTNVNLTTLTQRMLGRTQKAGGGGGKAATELRGRQQEATGQSGAGVRTENIARAVSDALASLSEQGYTIGNIPDSTVVFRTGGRDYTMGEIRAEGAARTKGALESLADTATPRQRLKETRKLIEEVESQGGQAERLASLRDVEKRLQNRIKGAQAAKRVKKVAEVERKAEQRGDKKTAGRARGKRTLMKLKATQRAEELSRGLAKFNNRLAELMSNPKEFEKGRRRVLNDVSKTIGDLSQRYPAFRNKNGNMQRPKEFHREAQPLFVLKRILESGNIPAVRRTREQVEQELAVARAMRLATEFLTTLESQRRAEAWVAGKDPMLENLRVFLEENEQGKYDSIGVTREFDALEIFSRFGEVEEAPQDNAEIVERLTDRLVEIDDRLNLERYSVDLGVPLAPPADGSVALDLLTEVGLIRKVIKKLEGPTRSRGKGGTIKTRESKEVKRRFDAVEAKLAVDSRPVRKKTAKKKTAKKKVAKKKVAQKRPAERKARPNDGRPRPDQYEVELPKKTRFAEKDQSKAKIAAAWARDKGGRNLFIGRGSANSSTRAYAEAYGDRANVGEYGPGDAVFISAEGNRNNRMKVNKAEIERAAAAGAVFVTDGPADRNRPYNVGEREVAEILTNLGYEEGVQPGVWHKPQTAAVSPEALTLKPKGKRNYKAANALTGVEPGTPAYRSYVEQRDRVYENPLDINEAKKREKRLLSEDQAKGLDAAYEMAEAFSEAYNIPVPHIRFSPDKTGLSATYSAPDHTIYLGESGLELLGGKAAKGSRKAMAIEVLYHEMAHGLQYFIVENASAEQANAIEAEYKAWRKKAVRMLKQGKNAQVDKRRFTAFDTYTGDGAWDATPYILSFPEWFADTAAGILVGKGVEVRAAAVKPLQKYANVLRELWNRMVEEIVKRTGMTPAQAQSEAPTLEAFLLNHVQSATVEQDTVTETLDATETVVQEASKGRADDGQRQRETEYAQSIVDGLQLEGVTVEVVSTAEAAQLAKEGTNLNEMDGLAFPELNEKTGEVHVKLWVNDGRVKPGGDRMGVLHHELGHGIVDALTHRISENDARGIWKAYEKWVVENNRGGTKLKDIAKSKRSLLNMVNYREGSASTLGQLTQAEQEQVLDFHEWFADQISRWIETSSKPRTRIEKFFKSIADALKQLVAKLGDRAGIANLSVRSTLDRMWDARRPNTAVRRWNIWSRVGERSEILSGKQTENLKGVLSEIRKQVGDDSRGIPPERIAVGAEWTRTAPFSAEAFFGARDIIQAKLTSQERKLLGKAFMQPKVRRKMYNLLSRMGHDADGIVDDTMSLMAIGYMFWQAGQIDLSPGGSRVFNSIGKFINDVTGRVGESEQAAEIMKAMQDDRLNARRSVLQENAKKNSNLARGAYTLGGNELARIGILTESRDLTTMPTSEVYQILRRDRIFGTGNFSNAHRRAIAEDITNEVFTEKFIDDHKMMSDWVLDPDKVFSVQKIVGDEPHQRFARTIMGAMEGAGNWFRSSIGKLVLGEGMQARLTGNAGIKRFMESLTTDVLQEGGREGYLNKKERQRGEWDAQFNAILENLNDKEQRQLRDLIQGKIDDAPANVKRARQQYRMMMRRFLKYARNAGLPMGDTGVDYFPWVFDPVRAEQKANQLFEAWSNPRYRQKWVELAQRHGDDRLNKDGTDFADDAAYEAYVLGWINGISSNNNGLVDAALPNQRNRDPAPHVGALNSRELNFLNDPDLAPKSDRELLSSLFSEDFAGSMAVYIDQLTKRVEYARIFGHRGEKFKQMVAQARESGATEQEIELMHNMLHSAMGTLGLEVAPLWKKIFEPVNSMMQPVLNEDGRPFPTRQAANKKLGKLKTGGVVEEYQGGFAIRRDITGDPKKFRDLFGWMVTYQNIRVLAFAAFTNLADVAGIAFRTGDFRMAMSAYAEGVREVRRQIRDRKLPRAERAARRSSAERLAEEIGVVVQASIGDVIGQFYGGNQFSGTAKKWNDKFFRWNGMEYLTRTTRTMATAAGSEFLAYHAQRAQEGSADSAEKLVELGLDYRDVRVDVDGRLQLMSQGQIASVLDQTSYATGRDVRDANAAGARLSPDLLDVARDDRVRQALYRMVDESVLRPTATQRPSWMNDPNWQLFSHLKAFMYTYHERVLRRAYGRAAQGNYGPMLLMSTYVAAIMAADLLREYVQHGPEGDDRKDDWGWRDRLVDGIHRSGTPGMFVLPMDMMKSHEYGSSVTMQLGGPFTSQVEDFYRAMSGRGSFTGALRESLPANQLFDAVGAYGSYALSRTAGEDAMFDVPLVRPEVRDAIKGGNED